MKNFQVENNRQHDWQKSKANKKIIKSTKHL